MSTDRNERIRQRAYEIWQQKGQPDGKEGEHWQQASEEIDAVGQQDGDAAIERDTSILGQADSDGGSTVRDTILPDTPAASQEDPGKATGTRGRKRSSK